MSDNPDISASLKLDLADYSRNVQKATREADEADAALDKITEAANDAEKALNNLSGDVKLDVDADFSSLLEADSTLQRMDTTISPLVDINVVNEAEAQRLLDEFNSTLSLTLHAETSELEQAEALLTRLDAEAPSIPVDVDDTELTGAQDTVDRLDSQQVDIPVDADTGDADKDLQSVSDKLDSLRKLAIIDLVMNLPAMIPSADSIPLLNTIIAADNAARSLQASLGELGKSNAATYAAGAQDVFTSGFGADQAEAANAYAEVVRLTTDDTGKLTTTNENFADVTKQGFVVAELSAQDFNTVIRAADTLVQTGLAPSYSDAFDLITTGFNEGLDKGGQFLDTITEFGTVFADLGVSGEGFLSLLKSGLEGGAKDTAQIGEIFTELNAKMRAAFSGQGAEFDAFKALGLRDELKAAQAGELSGTQFAGALIAAIEENAGKKNIMELATATLGSKAEELTLPVVIQLDPMQVQTELQNVHGATLEAQVLLGGDLGSSWERLRRTVEVDLAASVSKALDVPGKIQQFSDGVSKMSEELASGKGLPEAIEIAFAIPGFADTVATLESALGNLGIAILQVAANILEGVGQGEAAKGIRTTVSDLATGQLTFDLKLAETPEQVSAAVTTAINRGVEASDLQSGILAAGRELIASGDLEKATALRDAVNEVATTQAKIQSQGGILGGGLGGIGLNAEALKATSEVQTAAADTAGILDTELAAAETTISTRFDNMRLAAESKLPGMAEIATSSLTPFGEQVQGLSTAFEGAQASLMTMAEQSGVDVGLYGMSLETATGDVDAFASNVQTQFTETTVNALDTAGIQMDEFGITVTGVMLKAGEDVQGLIDKLLSIATLDIHMPNVGTGSSSGEGAGGGFASGGFVEPGNMARVHGGEQLISGGAEGVAVLNRQTSSVLDAAVAQYMASSGSGGGGSVTNNYISVNNTFNNMGAAASTASLDAARIRGY